MINKELVRNWVKVLRSGEYLQAIGKLRNGIGYCCLGVACEISQAGAWDSDAYVVSNVGDDKVLPLPMVELYGFGDRDPMVPVSVARKFVSAEVVGAHHQWEMVTLSYLNDHGATFADIANIIEAVCLTEEVDIERPVFV